MYMYNPLGGKRERKNVAFYLSVFQDSIGSSFSDSESFIGRIAYMDMWNRRLNTDEMFEFYTTCEPYQGNLLTWTDIRSHIYGAVKVIERKSFSICAKVTVCDF